MKGLMGIIAGLLMAVMIAASVAAAPSSSGPPYEQPIWFQWDQAELDILLVPPNHGQLYNDDGPLGGGGPGELTPNNSYLDAMMESIDAFRVAMRQFGPAWLWKGVKLNVYILGTDTVPQHALTEPDIVVVTDESKLAVLGIAIHLGLAQDGAPCIVNNSKLMVKSVSYSDMYNIMGQEFGHCLGLDHVAGGVPGDQVLAHDIMNGAYPHSPGAKDNPFHCLSNMNVAGLKVVFAPALGKKVPMKTVEMPARAYRTMDCRPAP